MRESRAGLENRLELHFAPVAAEDPHELVIGPQDPRPLLFGLHRHEVGEHRGAVGSREPGEKHVGLGRVRPFDAEFPGGADGEAAALPGVEEGGEDGIAVEPRPAEPVHRSVVGDESRAPAVADDRVPADAPDVAGPVSHGGSYRSPGPR